MKTKLVILLFGLLLGVLPVSAQDSTAAPTSEVTPVVTEAPTEVATAEATTVATVEATTEATTEATSVATVEATTAATAEATVEATVEATAAPTAEATEGPASPDGVKLLTGKYGYTDPSLPTYNSEVGVTLIDISGTVNHKFDPITGFNNLESPQFLGKITSPITSSPFSYELRLPQDPGGVLHDVNHDGKTDTGVMVYDVNFIFNIVGDGFLQREDVVWASSDIGYETYKNYSEIASGKILIYAPDDQQSIPSGFGPDGVLFTADDPITPVGRGWTVVNLNTNPFTLERSETALVNIIEAPLQETPNFSNETYTQAFDSMIAVMRKQYAYSEYYKIDWDALVAKYRPRIEKAEKEKGILDYETAIQDFIREFTDIHVGLDNAPALFAATNNLTDNIAGGIGMTVRELDDGRVIVNYVVKDGPADKAGIQVKAEIVTFNGKSAKAAVDSATALNPPDADYNHADVIRLDKERGLVRMPVGTQVELSYKNPDDSKPRSATLTAIKEDESRIVSRTALYGPSADTDVPLTYRVLDNGYGFIEISTFFDDGVLTNALWKRAMEYFESNSVKGIIIDLRHNGGGWSFNGLNMLSYLYDKQQTVGMSADYFPDLNRLEVNPLSQELIVPADDPTTRYHGKIAVMVSPFCVSECEFFSYALQSTGRGTIIGQYHTAGGGGSIQNVYLPEGVEIQFTFSRGLDATGKNVKIQGMGVVPDIKVPVTEDTVFADDAVLDAAEKYLDEATTVKTIDAGKVDIGQTVSGTFDPYTAEDYTFTATEDVTLTITLLDPNNTLDTMLQVFDKDGNQLAENDDATDGSPNSQIDRIEVKAGETVTIEASTYDPAQSGSYTLSVQTAG